jgi:hypothetical protein
MMLAHELGLPRCEGAMGSSSPRTRSARFASRVSEVPAAEHVKVTGANFENGLLIIGLKREVPEALKPRRIEIAAGSGQASPTNVTTLEQSKVA